MLELIYAKWVRMLLAALLLMVLGACSDERSKTATHSPSDTGENSIGRITLRGELVYRERIALRPGLTASVALLDTGSTGGEETVVTRVELSEFGQVPIAFSLTFPASAINPDHTYRIRATLQSRDGKVAWRTAEPVRIDALDESTIHQVLLQQKTLNTVQEQRYQCDGLAFTVVIDDYSATLQLEKRVLELPTIRAASGSKYSDGETVFWSKGSDEVFVILDDKTYKDCRAAN